MVATRAKGAPDPKGDAARISEDGRILAPAFADDQQFQFPTDLFEVTLREIEVPGPQNPDFRVLSFSPSGRIPYEADTSQLTIAATPRLVGAAQGNFRLDWKGAALISGTERRSQAATYMVVGEVGDARDA